jgi:pyridoxine 5-phosphate synthase
MVKLSVNVNKIATLRNSRGGNIPDLIEHCKLILDAGADGITVHPRADERHITKKDVFDIKEFLIKEKSYYPRNIEFNMEGELSERFKKLVLDAMPDQVTLVPVRPNEITSDHGFDLRQDLIQLQEYIHIFKERKIRVSIFMETDLENIFLVPRTGTDRVEFYTGPFANDFESNLGDKSFLSYKNAAMFLIKEKIGINAGHDLDTENLKIFSKLPGLQEVSIGHRLISSSLKFGLKDTVQSYLKILQATDPYIV